MSLKIKNPNQGGGNNQNIPRMEDGTYPARLVQIIDLGRQEKTDFQTGEKTGEYRPELFLTWEFPDETVEINGGQWPRWLSQRTTLSFNEKAKLVKIIYALDPKYQASDLSDLLGNAALVTVGSTKNNNPKITDVVALPKGMGNNVGTLQNTPKALDLSDPDTEMFNNLPNFIQEIIQQSPDCPAELTDGGGDQTQDGTDQASTEEFDDDVPF